MAQEKMATPAHEVWSERVREALGKRTIAELAELTGLAESSLRGHLRGKVLPRVDHAAAIAAALGRPLDWFTEVAADHDLDHPGLSVGDVNRPVYMADWKNFALLPLYDVRASAGHGAWNDEERIQKMLAFRRDWIDVTLSARAEDLMLIYVDGESMEPTLSDGDVVMVDQAQREGRTDGIYVFVQDDVLLIKRMQRLPGGRVKISSDNPRFDAYELPSADLGSEDTSPTYMVGRVVWAGVRL